MTINPLDALLAKLMHSSTKSSFEKTEEDMKEVFSRVDEMLPEEPEILEQLDYENVIRWFSTQPKHPDVRYGAIVKMPLDQKSIIVLQAFLDQYKNVIPKYEKRQYVRKLITESIDDELAECFGNNNAILVH